MATLRCSAVTVRAADRVLLDRVSLTVDDGTCCSLLGASGAGKSTLLRAVAGLVPAAGTITLGSRDLAGVAPHRRGVGLLFQRPHLFPTMRVVDNVAYPLRVRGARRGPRRAAATALLAEVGLADRAGAWPAELSGGEQQRVALARALCSDPDLLLLDEPFTGLDRPQRRDLVRTLCQVRAERGLTWLVVTHDPLDARTLGDTIAVLDLGRLVQHDTTASVVAAPTHPLVAALVALDSPTTGRPERTPAVAAGAATGGPVSDA